MDPMTQSAQISSSQGFADGQNSAAKESKLSDSFLSSSPVSLIQSPQDKRVVPGSDKPSEGVATSLRFPSQPGSFSPSNYGSEAEQVDGQPDSPIKTSPVSERIKALEALAAKKREPDFRGDGSYVHFRDRHQERSVPEIPKSLPEVPKSLPEVAKSLPEVPKSLPEVPKSLPEVPKSLPEVPKSLPEVPKSLPEVPKSLPEVPKSPPEVSKSLTETPKSLPEAHKSLPEAHKPLPEAHKPLPEAHKSLPEAHKSLPEAHKSLPEAPKSPPEKNLPADKKMAGPSDQESPESPFEVLGDIRQVNEFEETEEWMKAHLPPVPDFNAVGLNKCGNNVPLKEADMDVPDSPAAFAGVPDAFMDSPVEESKLKDDNIDEQKQGGVEEFDISFLPTAYVWDQQEKSSVQAPLNLDSVISSSPAPPAGFGPSPPSSPPALSVAKQNVSCEKKASWAGDPEAGEADSSGESDDTVIEDGVGAPASVPPPSFGPLISKDPTAAPDLSSEKENLPPKSERKLMQVPTINVIETDEPNYSEEEMEMEPEAEEDEDYEVVKDPAREPEPENTESEPPKTRPLETEFMEGYSPPSSPVDSDAEYSPKHKILQTVSETRHQQSQFKSEDLPDPAVSKDSTSEFSQPQSEKPQVNQDCDKPSAAVTGSEEVDFPDNDDEWSDEVQDILVRPRETDLASKESAPYNQSKVDEKSNKAAKDAFKETAPISITSFMQDEIYDRQSFDYDYDIPLDHSDGKGLNNAKERFLSDPGQNDVAKDSVVSLNGDEAFSKTIRQQSVEEYPQNPYSCFQTETLSSINEQDFIQKATSDISDGIGNDDVLQSHKPGPEIQQGIDDESPDGVDSSSSEPTDSFVDFMRECLKSRQDEGPDNVCQAVPAENEPSKTSLPPSQPTPSMVMDLEQEKLTISALKELGSSQDGEDLNLQPKVSDQNQANLSATSTQSVPHPPCSQSNREFDATYSKEVEAIDEWVAEAYHLAEHVLTAILTHLSVKDLIHWRDPKKSGLVFGLSMLLLLSLAAFSVISVASYLLLALLCVTITFRIYKSVVQAVQKSNDGHPFKALIDKDVSIPPETFRKHVDASLTYINRALKQMSRLFLVEDLVDSLKLAVVMWLLTYVGAVFNGITILILADILLFAVPPVYEKNKTQIDQYIDLVRTQVNTTMAKLQEKLPGAVKRSKTE